MVIYADLLREAIEPPSVVIGGKTFTGRNLSYEQFLRHQESLLLALEKSDDSLGSAKEQLKIVQEFLRDLFPQPPIPKKPKEPRPLNLFEKVWYWLSNKDPKRWQHHVDALDKWEKEVKEALDNDAVLVIMADVAFLEIFNRLFLSQRTVWMGQNAVMNTNDTQSSPDSLNEPNQENKN